MAPPTVTSRVARVAAVIALSLAGAASADAATPGQIGPALQTTGNGRVLHPAGRLTTVGDFPTGSAVTPGGRFLWVTDCGHGQTDVKVVDVASGAVVQTLPLPGCFGGVAFAPDGLHAYVSGLPVGSSPTEGATKGDQGDVVHVFSVDPATGKGVENDPLTLPDTTGGSARLNSLPPVSGAGTAQPEGLAVSPDGHHLVVALDGADDAVVIDLRTGTKTVVPVGQYPDGVAFDPRGRAYVSNAYSGSVSVIDPAAARVTATITGLGGDLGDLNSHPEGMVADPQRALLYVAVTNRDLVAVVDTNTNTVTRRVSVARAPAIGTAPTNLAISPDDTTLFASDAGEDAIAAISLSARATATASPSAKQPATGRAVYAPSSVKAITTYHAGRVTAARRLARVHGKRRAAAVRRYVAQLRSLSDRYLRPRHSIACAGPTSTQSRAYVHRILRALAAPSRRRAGLLAAAKRALPATALCATTPSAARAVFAPPSVTSITAYRTGRVTAARRLAHVHGTRRVAAARRYVTQLKSLSNRYLTAMASTACTGPTHNQERAYIRRVLRALAAPARRRPGLLAAARHVLPTITRCPAGGTIAGLPAYTLIGRIPTAAYANSVQTTPQGQLLWVAGKGFGSGPNPTYFFGGAKTPLQTPATTYGTYVLDLLIGRVGALALPSDQQIAAATPATDTQVTPSNQTAQPSGSPIPATTGHPSSQIKHVFYIVRENRTYDQVFGSDARGDGDSRLELFDDNGVSGPTGGITPNAHAITRQFPLLDNFYEDSEVSVDGHVITAGSYASDYDQQTTATNYSGRRDSTDIGIFPVSSPPNFFLFDQAAKQGVSFRDYGEAVGSVPTGGAPNRPQFATVEANTDEAYPNNVFIGCLQAGDPATCTQDSGLYNGTGTPFAGQSRFDEWYPEFRAQVAAGTVPSLNYMILPNDHTNGTTTNDPTPQAFIADNDLALGQMVDAISHSSIWSSSAIFVVEDDSQDGADHVDSHRAPALVISPYAKHGTVVHTRYDQYSVLRSIELILGLQPLSLNDGLATPMYDAFISGGTQPDETPYAVTQPSYPLTSRNSASSAMTRLSNRLPFNTLDATPQAISDQVLWASVHGARSRPPAPGPNASPDEVDRASVYRRTLRSDPQAFRPARPSAAARAAARGTASCPITWACRPSADGDG